MRHCPRCGTTKPLSEFTPDKTKASGYASRCKPCDAARSRGYYHRTNGAAARARYQANREDHLAKTKAWAAAHPDKVREYWRNRARVITKEQRRATYMKRHGGMDEWTRMFADQHGLCYLCTEPLEGTEQQFIHVDHDHDCCPSGQRTESCRNCRRGLAHAWCNQIIGLCGEDMAKLRTIIANFEPARDAAAARIAAKKAAQPTLL